MSTRKLKQDAYDRTLKRRYAKAKTRAKRQGRKFTISLSAYESLISSNACAYCGGELEKTGSSLDRVDSKYGYTKKNVVTSCKKCNIMKSNLSLEEFFKHLQRILKYVKF